MGSQRTGKPDWQVALEHHEALCAERCNSIDRRFDAVDQRFETVDKRLDNIEKLQRVAIGGILAGCFVMPAILVALLKFF